MRESCIQSVKNVLESLDSTRFEKLCYVFVDFITGDRLHHRGENIQGESVGYTVDSYSDDGRIVGEYSVDKNYFSDLKKAKGDIAHALDELPDVEELYLCAGIEASPSQGIDMANLCKEYEDITIKWYDARFMAEIIATEIINQNEVLKKMTDIVPALAKAIGENNISNKIPELPENYSFSSTTVQLLLNKLKKNHLLYLHGISGIGKTMLSVYLQKELLKTVQVHNVEFINVSRISAMEELRQFKDPMFGYGIDLLHTMQSEKTIFILDDLCKDLDKIVAEIKHSVGKDSYVIITSQLACLYAQNQELSFEIGNLDRDTANYVFSYKLKNPGTEQQMELLYRKTAGYPMLLNAVRSLMQCEDLVWEELEEELAHSPDYEVEEGIQLTKKLLKRHQEVLKKELFAIHWLQSKYISQTLLKKLICREGIRKLKSRSFLQELPEVFKVHDIVYECINALNFEPEMNSRTSADYEDIFYKELEEGIDKKDAEYYRMLHLHEDKILSIAQASATLGKQTYFYLQAFPNDEKGVLKGYSEESVNEMIQKTTDAYVYKSIIEWYELNLRKMKKRHAENLSGQVQVYICNLGLMLDRLNGTEDLYIDILHHQGKLYHNIEQDGDAMNCFEEVLQLAPNAFETKLQIARIKDKKEQKEERIAIYKEILDHYISGGEISMSVVLAAYEDIASYLYSDNEIKKKYFIDYFEYFKNAIISLSGTTFDQPYIVLANVSKIYTYDYPDYLKELSDRLHFPSIEKIHKRNYFNIARMYMEFGKALRNLDKACEEAESYFEMAESYFENMDSKVRLRGFEVVQRAESFLLLKRYNDAIQFLDTHACEDEVFWWYRKSCALLCLDEYSDARKCCDKALERMGEKSSKERYLSTFYRKRAQIAFYNQEGEETVKYYLDTAIRNCSESKYKEQLVKERETYQSEGRVDKD